MRLQLNNIPYRVFLTVLDIVYCGIFVTAEFITVPVVNFAGFISVAAQWLVISISSLGVLSLLSVNRMAFAAFFPLLLVVSTVVCYYTVTIGARLNAVSIELAVVNDASMWVSMLSAMLVAMIACSFIVGVSVACYRWKCVSISGKGAIIWSAVGLAVVAGATSVSS